MVSASAGPIADGDRVGLCLDVDGTIHRHGSIFVESLAVLPYASDLPIEGRERELLTEALGTVAAYAGQDQSRRRWLGALRVCDVFDRVGLGSVAAHVLVRLIRYRATQASGAPATGETEGYRDMQRRILDQYGAFLEGRRRDRTERAFEQVASSHLRAEPSIRETLAALTAAADIDVVLVTDVPTHIARPYAGLVGAGVDAVGTDFETVEGRFTGDYTFIKKGAEVERMRAERGWDYVLAAGDSANDLPMAAAADLFVAVAGRGNVGDDLPSDYRTIEASEIRPGKLPSGTDAIRVPQATSLADVLETTFGALGIETN